MARFAEGVAFPFTEMHLQIHWVQNEADDFRENWSAGFLIFSGLTEGKCFHAAVIVFLFCPGILNGDPSV